ncbi:MAG: methyltransferase domain-containing protein [Actinobacteria bacterium]|nr:methyltransferase domain-containing protein [Actinomycetota bacterium]
MWHVLRADGRRLRGSAACLPHRVVRIPGQGGVDRTRQADPRGWCWAGLATRELVNAGCRVTALEPGARLAAWAAELVPEATVITSTLEDADLSSAAYDCAVAATAMHWVDPMVGVPTFHRALRPSGHIVIWRHVFGRDEVDRSNFRRHVDRSSPVGRPTGHRDAEDRCSRPRCTSRDTRRPLGRHGRRHPRV